GSGASRRAPPPPPSCAPDATTRCRRAARRACPAAPGTPSCEPLVPQLAQERVRAKLPPERRRGTVPRPDDRLLGKAVEQHAHRVEERLPVAAGQVDAADRAREEQI